MPRSFQGALPERAPDVDPLTGEAEWICPLCGVDNFYKRFDCYRCHEKKPGDAVIGELRVYKSIRKLLISRSL